LQEIFIFFNIKNIDTFIFYIGNSLIKLSSCISLNPVAVTTNTVCVGLSINFSVSTTGTTTPTYSWSGPNTFTANIQNPSIATSSSLNSGVYTVTVTNGSCIETATAQVNVTICTGVNSNLEDNLSSVIVYPNPSSSILNIKTGEPLQEISIYNTLGALVQTEKTNTFSVEQLPAGIYILQIKTEKGTSTVRFIKE